MNWKNRNPSRGTGNRCEAHFVAKFAIQTNLSTANRRKTGILGSPCNLPAWVDDGLSEVAILKSIRVEGLTLRFYSNDHDPPHFHAERPGEWELRVKFLLSEDEMLEIAWANKKKLIPVKYRKRLIKEVREHRDEIQKEWEKKVHLQ